MTTMVLTVIGDDRAGLIEALASVIAGAGGNWDESHMAELGGKFAGVVLVTVAADRASELTAALEPLEERGLLDITVTTANDGPALSGRRFGLELVGHDQPGIVREISSAMAGLNVSIEELRTETKEAPHAGGTLFSAVAQLVAPAGVEMDQIRSELEDLSNQLMVDIELSSQAATGA